MYGILNYHFMICMIRLQIKHLSVQRMDKYSKFKFLKMAKIKIKSRI